MSGPQCHQQTNKNLITQLCKEYSRITKGRKAMLLPIAKFLLIHFCFQNCDKLFEILDSDLEVWLYIWHLIASELSHPQ
jgi:hypothetical protein